MTTKELITELIDFCTKPHTATELISLGLPGFPTSNPGFFMRMRRLGVALRPRKQGGSFVFYFFDFPVEFQREIIIFFMRRWIAKGINQNIDEIIVDVLLFACASRNLEFARSWRKREKRRSAVLYKISKLLQSLK